MSTIKTILGVKVTAHDTGAALLYKGRIVAISEERLNRVKHSRNMFPKLAVDYCLAVAGISDRHVDMVVLDQVGSRSVSPSEMIFKKNTGSRFAHARLFVINHHDAHAASAFFASPFNDAAVLVVDGAGERFRTYQGVLGTETETSYRGTGNKLVEIGKTLHIREKTEFPYTVGIGKLYTLICEGYLNLGHYNEGKMMGLAPYGDRRVLDAFPFDRWFKEKDGQLVCNPNIIFDGIEEFRRTKKSVSTLDRIKNRLFRTVAFKLLDWGKVDREGSSFILPSVFEPICLEKTRRRNETLPDPYYAATAHAVQKVLEEVMVHLGKKVKAITDSENICVAGGVGLNIDANKRFLDDVGFKHIFVQPASSDTGIPLGCVLWGAHQILELPRFYRMDSGSLGRTYTSEEITVALASRQNEIIVKQSVDVVTDAAELIASGKIVAWFQGGAEYGPRALGNRSILCDARDPEMKNTVNRRVKHRELWRPFAASVLAEKQREWFELDEPSPFMLLAAKVPDAKQKLIPSVVHVDGTCRIQAVTEAANPIYYKLLKAFERKTGVPLFLNTSFNDAGEPIVETPMDALNCFLKTDMDALVIHDKIVTKKRP
jgi:carbamoyltransferase